MFEVLAIELLVAPMEVHHLDVTLLGLLQPHFDLLEQVEQVLVHRVNKLSHVEVSTR